MSRNAQPAVAGGGAFPDWFQLARRIVDHLYPESNSDDRHRQSALDQIKATSGILRISQEYQAAFGRTALDRLIADSVPDERFEPGDLHELLLELPWSDVFTTNWDTLLERGTRRLLDRRYDVVRTTAEIPRSMKPRIVKLHGSFPSNAPFVLTEDDFRTYPRDFAPFVNMAQQSMMENVFCLIGFSGDDPNFLFWSGWVRDHLGEAAPMIYLVGWLELTAARRRLLEDRNVVPVDLSTLPGAHTWSVQSRHRKSLEWFLWNLKNGEPYSAIGWPEPHSARRMTSLHGIEIPIPSSAEPKKEIFAPRDPSPERLVHQIVQNEITIWQHNRSLYPGWVVAPREIRERVWMYTERWIEPILSCLGEIPVNSRLQALDALNWRLEVCLVPLTSRIADPIDQILREADPSNLQTLPGGSTLQASWLRLALARLRYAREMDDATGFDFWLSQLRSLVAEFSWLDSKLLYERCLYALSLLDHAAVERILSSWREPEVEPFWGILKASLLAEIGLVSEAYRLSFESLARIQQRSRKDVVDIASLSREGWAMMLCYRFSFHEYRLEREAREEGAEMPDFERTSKVFRKRWDRLAAHKCDPWVDFDGLRERLNAAAPRALPAQSEYEGFDPSLRGVTFRTSDDLEDRLRPAHQFRRLVEEAGIPAAVTVSLLSLGQESFLRVASWLADTAPKLAIGILLRVRPGDREESLEHLFTRPRIALMDAAESESLVSKLERSLDHCVDAAEKVQTADDPDRFLYWLSRIEFGTELLSRLTLRLPPDRAEAVFRRALRYVNSALFQNRHELLDLLEHLLRWSIEAMGPGSVRNHVLDLVALPVPGAGSFEPQASYVSWPEPVAWINPRNLENSRPRESEDWTTAIERLIRAVEREGPYPRSRAIRRLYLLDRAGLLEASEKSRFATALWEYCWSRGRLPGDNSELYEWTALRLPEPELGLAERAFRAAYLSPENHPLTEWWIKNLVSAVNSGLVLAPSEVDVILESTFAWWRGGGAEETTRERVFLERGDPRSMRWPVAQLLWEVILPRLPLEDNRIASVWELVEDLRRLSFPVEPLYPPLTRLRPDLKNELFRRLRSSLASSDADTAVAAVEAIWSWLRFGPSWNLDPPPADLPREIALAISVRRPSNLMKALRAVEWIFAECPEARTDEFDRFVVEGLEYLLGQTRYESHATAVSVLGWPHLSELRAQCVRVAQAMQSADLGGEAAVREWLRVKEIDPLAEVRFAQSEWNRGRGEATL
jgi:hypothetical protein